MIGDITDSRRRCVFRAGVVALIGLAIGPSVRAETGQTNIVDGVTVNEPASYAVGTNGAFNALIVTNAGVLNVAGTSVVGGSTVSSNNAAWVTGAGSAWGGAGNLYAGASGSFNSLTIANGGLVSNAVGYVGWNFTSSNNSVWVTGAGSVWSNGNNLFVGNSGDGNSLTVSNGATVVAVAATVGNNAGANGNSVVVTGPGSLWTNSGSLTMGNAGSGNQLIIADGGRVVGGGFSSSVGSGSSSSNNLVLVSGAGSVWTVTNILFAGSAGSFNRIELTNGGQYIGGGGAYLGYATNSVGNRMTVTGSGSVWSNNNFLSVGTAGYSNRMIIADGGQVLGVSATLGTFSRNSNNSVWVTGTGSLWSNAGSLQIARDAGIGNSLTISNGGRVFDQFGVVGDNSSSTGNAVFVTGFGSLWDNGKASTNMLVVGRNGSFNQLVIADGALVLNYTGMVGQFSSATGNSALVTGPGSVWSNAGNLFVGNSGSANSLVISNSGRVVSSSGYVGNNNTASNNTARVTGPGSHWIMTNINASLYIGMNGVSNNLTVADGGVVSNKFGYIGFGSLARDNSVLVTGAGSVWSNGSSLNIGSLGGSGNLLTISNAGWVVGGLAYVGTATNSRNNIAWVTDAGSFWTNSGSLTVGHLGGGNGLVVSNGARVMTASAILGLAAGAWSNSAAVTGGGSVWDSGIAPSSYLSVGRSGSFNQLTVADGAQVFSYTGIIGQFSSATGNSALVAGPGSLWSNANNLLIGDMGSANGLTITDGGLIRNERGIIGNSNVSFGNTVLVTGPGSLWSNASQLNVGNFGSFNQLILSNGGQMFVGTTGSYLGASSTVSSNNSLLITGTGSVFRSTGNLRVGHVGVSNSLIITDGGQAHNITGYIGNLSGSSNNWAVVTGPGSLWSNAGHLYVGGGGSGCQLTITNGGTVVNNDSYIGNGSTNNRATVTGTGSIWRNTNALYVGLSGDGHQLVVNDGGRILSMLGVIGNASTSSNNTAWLTDPGSVWSNAGSLFVGAGGSYNSLSIANSAQVFSANGYLGNTSASSNNLALVTGAGSVWSNRGQVVVGNNGSGNRVDTANAARFFSVTGTIGNATISSNNSVLVTGTGSVWRNSGTLTVGNSGSQNQLVVTNGGQVISAAAYVGYNSGASSNLILVAGPGSLLSNSAFNIGENGAGNSLVIRGGGQGISSSVSLGWSISASNNAALVTDAGSVWNAGSFMLGLNSRGNTLTVTNGGQVHAVNSAVGWAGRNNTALLAGTGSIWTNSGFFWMGASGGSDSNSLMITDGGQLLASSSRLGDNGRYSTALVTGTNSLWRTTGDFILGNGAGGNQLTITDSATLVATSLLMGAQAIATGNLLALSGGNLYVTNTAATGTLEVRRGTLAFDGGTLLADRLVATNGAQSVLDFNSGLLRVGALTISNGVPFAVGDGLGAATLDLGGGSHLLANGLLLASNAVLTGPGTIAGDLTLGGTLSPGSSPGLLTITGDLTLEDGSETLMELAGAGIGQYDQVAVGGLLRIGGLIEVTLTNGFRPNPGDTFNLFDYGSVTGSFSQVNLPTVIGPADWDTQHLDTDPSDPLAGSIIFIPEPGAGGLLLCSLAILALRRHQKPAR